MPISKDQDQSMQLKTYRDFRRQLADVSPSGALLTAGRFGSQTKMATDTSPKMSGNKRTFLFEGTNGAADATSHLISNSLSSSNHSNRKRIKSSDLTMSPLSLPRNSNNDSNSVVSSSNSSINTGETSNQVNNGNIPFAANTWWKKGNENLRDFMSTSINSASGLPSSTNVSCDNSCDSTSRNGVNNNLNGNGNALNNSIAEVSPTPFPSSIGSSVKNSGMPGNQRPAAWLKLLGEVASSGSNGIVNPQQRMMQQQQELQALRMQENGSNKPFLLGSASARNSNILNNTSISRMSMQHLPQGNMLDPSNFLSDGMNMAQMQLHQQQQQLFQQRHLQQQSMYHPFAFSQGNGQFNLAQSSMLQERQNQAQRQQMQRPAAARDDLKIDGLRSSGAMGVASLPAMDRELEAIGFGGDAGNSSNSNVRKTINASQNQIMDVNDLGFSDMVPAMQANGTQGFDGEDLDMGIDMDLMAANNSRKLGHQRIARSSHLPSDQSKAKETPKLKEVKFRAYQAENWTEKFEELLRFREENGHCLVPNCHPDNPALAQWTKRQRYQYKLKQDGKRSTITDERVQALDEAGFVWDSHKAVWAERLEELKEFKKRHNHCNVPSRYKANHQLAIWVKRQRRQWKNKMDRLPNCMTDERQRALEAIGFVWDMKKGKKSPQNSPNRQQVMLN